MRERRDTRADRIAAFAAVLGAFGVTLGAFGAHALADRLSPEASAWWHTATLYLLVHAAAGLGAAGTGRARCSSALLLGGAALFSATLYAMALGAPRWLGMVTPLGGLGMIAGWVGVAWGLVRPADTRDGGHG
ncbi:MAG: DUF423 domain-containing protein [Planctomycetota bacterium]|nr:MAG: DUF423 domain-containing protein [Planctomycetota bacterium]